MNRLLSVIFALAIVALSTSVRATPISIVPLGDSITEGFNSVDSEGGYRPILYNELTAQGVQIQYQGVYDDGSSPALTAIGQGMQSGFSGFSSIDIYNNLAGSVHSQNSSNSNLGGYWMTGGNGTGRTALDPNIVLLLTGANDWDYSPETETYVPLILQWFTANLPSTEVIVGTTPPEWGYNNALELATEADTAFLQSYVPLNDPQDRVVDVPSAFLNPDGSINESLIPEYSVHPNQAGYQVIANVFDAAIESSVPEPTATSLIIVGAAALIRRRRQRRWCARRIESAVCTTFHRSGLPPASGCDRLATMR